MARRLVGAIVGLGLSAAFYLLLIDTTDLPELYVLAGVAVLATALLEASRELGFAEASIRPRWLLGSLRVLIRVPGQLATVSWQALVQLIRPEPVRGAFRAVPFEGGGEPAREAGRRAMAEAIGSFTPNTIVIGVDPERRLLLVHQLHRRGGREELDPLGLG